MRTDLALQIHYRTLSKVKLFQDCDSGLLKELVVKLSPTIYLPGDYICRKDDIGREMYIVKSGFVQVINLVIKYNIILIIKISIITIKVNNDNFRNLAYNQQTKQTTNEVTSKNSNA